MAISRQEMTPKENKPHLFIFGPGYSARAVANIALKNGWKVSGTYRNTDRVSELTQLGIHPVSFDEKTIQNKIKNATHWLVSTAPDDDGDPSFHLIKSFSKQLSPGWVGYLSSTNVYGDHRGAWVDETTPTNPGLKRGQRRVAAEKIWSEYTKSIGATLHVFRLAGIYGPGRNAVRSLLDQKAKRIVKAGQKFSRIHVVDIAETVWAAINSHLESMVFNVADDKPSPPQDVVLEAAKLLNIAPPPEVPFDQAPLSPMAKSFYMENKLVRNDLVKQKLGITLRYPSYEVALKEFIKLEK